MDKKILVERETFETNGKEYFSYFIKGVVRGKEVKLTVAPPDKGGYTVLDIVFGDSMQAELAVKPFEIKDEKTGKVVSGNTYSVVGYDEDGLSYECAIKPYRSSDKSLLAMILR